jgi:hypothetical protein
MRFASPSGSCMNFSGVTRACFHKNSTRRSKQDLMTTAPNDALVASRNALRNPMNVQPIVRPVLLRTKALDQCGKGRRLIPAAWIREKVSEEGRAPVLQNLNNAAFVDRHREIVLHGCTDAKPFCRVHISFWCCAPKHFRFGRFRLLCSVGRTHGVCFATASCQEVASGIPQSALATSCG